MKLFVVRAKIPVRYNGIRFELGDTFPINAADMNEDIFEFIEEVVPGTEEDEKGVEEELKGMKVDELKKLAKEKGIEGYADMKKDDLIQSLKG